MAEPEQEVVPQAVLSPLTRAAIFLVVTAVMALTFAFAVAGHGRKDPEDDLEDDDEDPQGPGAR